MGHEPKTNPNCFHLGKNISQDNNPELEHLSFLFGCVLLCMHKDRTDKISFLKDLIYKSAAFLSLYFFQLERYCIHFSFLRSLKF